MTKNEAMYRIIGQGPPPPPPTPQTAQLTVSSSPISGVMATISQSLVPIHSGNTPMTFVLEVGQAYMLSIADAGVDVFDRWTDGDTNREKIIQPLSTAPLNFTAIFRSIGPPPPPPSTGIPATPTGLAASQTAVRTTALLTWNPVSGATGYVLHRSSTIFPPVTDIPVSAPPFQNTGLSGGTAGNTYTYRISAVNSFGQSAQSGPVTIFISPATGLPPPPPTGGGAITSVTCNYWQYVNVENVDNVYAEVGFVASQPLMSVRCVMVVRSGAVIIDTLNHDLTYPAPGKSVANIPMYRNIPSAPTSVTLEFYFVDPANPTQKISPTISVPGVNRNSFSGQLLPLAPLAPNTVSLKIIYYAYQLATNGVLQVRIIATYRAAASVVGQSIRARMSLYASGNPTAFRRTTYAAPGVPAAPTGVLILRSGTELGLDPPSIDGAMHVIDAAGATISTVHQWTVQKGSEFP